MFIQTGVTACETDFPRDFFTPFFNRLPNGRSRAHGLFRKAAHGGEFAVHPVQPDGNERMSSLWIEEMGNPEHQLQKYDIVDVAVSAQKCLPTYGYTFQPEDAAIGSLLCLNPSTKERRHHASLTLLLQWFHHLDSCWCMAGG
ncbi:hypothetical protein CWS02_04190 [Enterobacter sp. EA-1]|nr:hypothetical protein CWS02_04190 [Enterobacter sp. EA-1]